MISKQVLEFREKELHEFTIGMLQKMTEALQKDPSRAIRPWKVYSRRYIDSRLVGEFLEWKERAEKLDGIIEKVMPDEPDNQKLTKADITPILAEILELYDIADFCFFKVTLLNDILRELDE